MNLTNENISTTNGVDDESKSLRYIICIDVDYYYPGVRVPLDSPAMVAQHFNAFASFAKDVSNLLNLGQLEGAVKIEEELNHYSTVLLIKCTEATAITLSKLPCVKALESLDL